jgi:hypothetical protein
LKFSAYVLRLAFDCPYGIDPAARTAFRTFDLPRRFSMKTFAKSILISSILAIVTSSSMVAQTSNGQFDQWYRAKYGRPSPSEQAGLTTPATQSAVALSTNGGFEQWYRAKYGRPSPSEQARLETLPINVATPAAMQPMVMGSLVGQMSMDQTPTLGKQQLKRLIATAKTPAEHERIAQDYRDEAQNYLAQAQEHAAMVAMYKANPSVNAKNQAATINHCEYFAAKFNSLVVKSQELAKMHEQMATDAARN